jgi:hypothetical protein
MSMPMAGMTPNEQKQQLSVAYVHAVAARAGYACQVKTIDDDSIDVEVAARGKVHINAVLRSPKIAIQLKATSQDLLREDHVAFHCQSRITTIFARYRSFPGCWWCSFYRRTRACGWSNLRIN